MVLATSHAPAAADEAADAQFSFRDARRLLLHGEYEKAMEAYNALSKQPDHRLRALCGRAQIDLELGAYREGIARLQAAGQAAVSSPDWHVHLAALHAAVGDYQDAVKHNRRAIELQEEHLQAHWQLGRLMEITGRVNEAIDAYEIFENILTGDSLPKGAEASVTIGRGFYRYSVLKQKDHVNRTKHVLDELFDGTIHYVDADYWPARLAAGELRLERHWLSDARVEFDAILKQNPRAADALVGLGRALLDDWKFEDVEKQAGAALEINPNHVEALLLLADTRMTERRFDDAAAYAERALSVNPNSIEALGVLAGARRRAMGTAAGIDLANALQARAEQVSRKPAAFHLALGKWLSDGRQFSQAEPHFKKAIEYAPWWPAPRTALGQLYMETGEEKLARQALEASFGLDSFDHHTFNVLDLLDQLDAFSRLESEHFVVKYDEKDAIIAPYFSESLEALHEEVCADFETQLDKNTIIEVFPEHEGFSVRITGRPFIATVGACTGRVIAMTAPRGRPPFGRFNWVSVLRHEFTHTVTLAATENRIPHWMTEGLAVHEEMSPRSWEWKEMLSDAVRRGRLFTLESIDWGFMRPRRVGDRELAYAQSEWMMEYIIERFRYDAVLDFLKAFRDGLPQSEAIRRVLEIEPGAFDRDFAEWATSQVRQWGLPAAEVEDPAALREKHEENPDDAALLSRLALAELLDGEPEKAEKAALAALRLDDNQASALEVLSRLFVERMLDEKDDETRRDLMRQAEPFVRRLHRASSENPLAIKYLGYIEQAWGNFNDAIGWYQMYQQRFSEDPDTYRRLAGIYLSRNKQEPALEQMEALFRLSEDEPAVAKQIASIYAQRGDDARAAHWYLRALHIDPYDLETHGALADAYFASKQLEKAKREYEVVTKMLPDDAIGYEGLSRVNQALGNTEAANSYKKQAEALRGKGRSEPEGKAIE